jgi:hypothetical protein
MIGAQTMIVEGLKGPMTITQSLKGFHMRPTLVAPADFARSQPRLALVMDASGPVLSCCVLMGHPSNHLIFRCVTISNWVVRFGWHFCCITDITSQWGLGFAQNATEVTL